MDCNETKRLLGAYVDDELELSHQLDMEAHLAACSPCKKVVEAAINFRFSVRMNMPAYKATSGARKKNSSCVTEGIRIPELSLADMEKFEDQLRDRTE